MNPWSVACQAPQSMELILQARIIEWVAIPFSRGSFWPRDWSRVSCSAGRFFSVWVTYLVTYLVTCLFQISMKWSEVAQSCLTLCDPMDCSLPGSSVHGIFQARVLEWVAISFSRRPSQPKNRTWVSCIADRCFTVRHIWNENRKIYSGQGWSLNLEILSWNK